MEAERPGKAKFRVGLVSHDEIRIAGIRAALEGRNDAEIVLMTHPGILESLRVSLVLIDLASPDHLIEVLTVFHRLHPRVRLLVIGGPPDQAFIEHAISVGARGVLSHEATEEELRMAVQVVCDGSVWAPRKVLSRLLDRADAQSPVGRIHLTAREIQVLTLLVRGLPNGEIAISLKVKSATVKAHLGRLMRKAGVTNRIALTTHALNESWL